MTGYTTGTGNQTTNDGTWTYSYDAEGNLTKKSKGANLETWNYSYDQQNHLVTVEKHATDGGTLQLKVQYKYDALGDRIERTEDSNGDGNVDVTERFGYDGANVWADLDGNNGLTYRRLFGPGIDDPVARITAAGTVVWYLLDYQNSVIGMVDSTGSSLGSITYDGFGNILTNTTGVNGDRYGFTSREWDSAVSLQYNRARYYDPNLGKWTSMDPLGFAAGDANLYRYVGNGPTNGVDPSGLASIRFQIIRGNPKDYPTGFILKPYGGGAGSSSAVSEIYLTPRGVGDFVAIPEPVGEINVRVDQSFNEKPGMYEINWKVTATVATDSADAGHVAGVWHSSDGSPFLVVDGNKKFGEKSGRFTRFLKPEDTELLLFSTPFGSAGHKAIVRGPLKFQQSFFGVALAGRAGNQ